MDGSHPDIKVGPHRDYQEEAGSKFEQKKLRGFKKGSREIHHSSMGRVGIQGLEDRGSKAKGRPSRGNVFTTVSAGGEAVVDVGVSRVSPSWDSSPPSPPASNQGKKGFQGKARRARNVVFVPPAASSSSSPSQVVQEQQRDAKANTVVRIKG